MSTMSIPRRRLIMASAASLTTGLPAILAQAQAPAAITLDRNRPAFPSGVQSGDVLGDRGMVWARSDRPARMWVEWSTAPSFSDARMLRGPYALEATDFTARMDLVGLPAGQEIFYRVTWEDLDGGGVRSEPMIGHFRTAPRARRDVRFLWSGDTAGQGFGINEDFGGMKIYESMRRLNPDFFIHSGDTVYADGVIEAEVKLPDGSTWRNLTTEEKSKVAETLKEFRGAYRYNTLDKNVRAFNREVMQIWQWDDGEVYNNYSSNKDLRTNARYQEKSLTLLTARGRRAFLENAPMRWHAQEEEERVYRKIAYGPLLDVFVVDMFGYRGPNGTNRQAELDGESQYFGPEQMAWLRRELKASRATWKVIAADVPLGVTVPDGQDAQGRPMFEGSANGDGPALGREIEVSQILSFIKHQRVTNVVWLTADVHYTAAHYYNPHKAKFQDFEPFWEFVSGPLNAGTFGPNEPDDTFGIEVRYQKVPPAGQQALAPTAGMQFFGDVQIDARTAAMTVHLRDIDGRSLWNTTLQPQRA